MRRQERLGEAAWVNRTTDQCTYCLKQFHTEEECYGKKNDTDRYGKAAVDREAKKRRQERLAGAPIMKTTDEDAPRPWKHLRQPGQQGVGYTGKGQEKEKKISKVEVDKARKEGKVRGFQRAETPSRGFAGRRNV